MSNEVSIQLTPESKAYLARLSHMFGRDTLLKRIYQFFIPASAAAAGHVVKTQLSGQALQRRSGILARSMMGEAVMYKGLPGFRVGVFRGPALRYAATQEYGTKGENPQSPIPTIVPRRTKTLGIPVGPALTDAGVARFASPRDYPVKLKFIPFRKSGVAVGGFFEESSIPKHPPMGWTLKQARMAYLLVSKTDIKPHWYIRKGVMDYLPKVAQELSVFLREMMHGMR